MGGAVWEADEEEEGRPGARDGFKCGAGNWNKYAGAREGVPAFSRLTVRVQRRRNHVAPLQHLQDWSERS
jgi:hypothetical protein